MIAPHPFREIEHRPCMCPRCRPLQAHEPRLRPIRIALVVIGGAVWPLIALLVNLHFHVVELGVSGHLALLLATASAVANVVLLPTRRDRLTRLVVTSGPQATWLRVTLLAGALLGCLAWGYLSLLMLPLLPLSAIAIIFFGLGLCGFTPFVALSVALVQVRRAARAVSERLGARAVALIVLGGLLGPPLAGGAAGLWAWSRQVRLEAGVAAVAAQAPHSAERLQAIAALEGSADRLPTLLADLHELEQQRAAAEAFLLLTDRRINEAVDRTRRDHEVLIRPLWFLEGRRPRVFDGSLFSHFLRF
jgi:hypothetical protein